MRQREDPDASPRGLSAEEHTILAFLLAAEFPGVQELRAQADFVQATPWGCGCPSVDLHVDRGRAPRSSVTERVAVEAQSKERNDPDGVFELLLWVDEGWLSGIEFVNYREEHGLVKVFPPPEAFDPPIPQ